MTRTSPVTLVLTALVAAVVGFAVDSVLVGSGRPVLPMPATVGLVLAVLGVVVVAFAWPVRRMVRGGRAVGFRHATSALALAKSSSLVAVVAGGWAGGALLFVVTRAVIPGQIVGMGLVTLGGAIMLLVAALLAESWCVLPPDDEGASPA